MCMLEMLSTRNMHKGHYLLHYLDDFRCESHNAVHLKNPPQCITTIKPTKMQFSLQNGTQIKKKTQRKQRRYQRFHTARDRKR